MYWPFRATIWMWAILSLSCFCCLILWSFQVSMNWERMKQHSNSRHSSDTDVSQSGVDPERPTHKTSKNKTNKQELDRIFHFGRVCWSWKTNTYIQPATITAFRQNISLLEKTKFRTMNIWMQWKCLRKTWMLSYENFSKADFITFFYLHYWTWHDGMWQYELMSFLKCTTQ